MFSNMRAVLATLMALVAPLAFYSADKITLALPDEITPVPPPVHRLQTYLRLRTDQPEPAYDEATSFLNRTVAALLPSASFSTHSFVPGKPVIIVRLSGSRPELPSILLNSHVDVVPAEEDKWTLPPFTARLAVREGQVRIYARGSQDMKSVGMQYVEALSNLVSRGWRPLRTIYMSFVPDEEIGGVAGMGMLVKSQQFKEMNVGVALDEGLPRADGKFDVYYGERRTWWLIVKAVDRPGHGALMPESTAAVTMGGIIEKVLAFRRKQFAIMEAGTDVGDIIGVNLNYMKGGIQNDKQSTGFTMNVIPSQAEIGLDVRVPPSFSWETMEEEIKRWMYCDDGNICPGVSYHFVHQVMDGPVTSRKPEENPYIVPFANGLSKAGIANRLRHGIFFAATDSRYLREMNIPCFGFTPVSKTANLLHKHDEYIPVEEYLNGIGIYEKIIRELAEFNPKSTVTDADLQTVREEAMKEMAGPASSTDNRTSQPGAEGEGAFATKASGSTRARGGEQADEAKQEL